ncbi:MAG: ClpXP protease specificity-enhancing factor [Panacagrimonas sp.]
MSKQSRRSYLIRAIYDWATDHGHTPHMLVAADVEGVVVPREFVQDNRITLNVSPMAVQSLDLQSDPIWFSARFSGRPFEVTVPVGAVLAIFARENGEGLVFGEVEPTPPKDATPPPKTDDGPKKGGPSRSHLRVVK